MCFSCDILHLYAKVTSLKIELGEISLQKYNERGGWNKNIQGGKFLKKYLVWGTSTKHSRVCECKKTKGNISFTKSFQRKQETSS